jgi:hypothetical protein
MPADPNDPQLNSWLCRLKPEIELAIRLAMRERFIEVRSNSDFEARIVAVLAKLGPDKKLLTQIRGQAKTLEGMIDRFSPDANVGGAA